MMGSQMSATGTHRASALHKQRGISLIEVMIAIVLLTMVFLYVSENLIAASAAES